jgi:hypothetical protein
MDKAKILVLLIAAVFSLSACAAGAEGREQANASENPKTQEIGVTGEAVQDAPKTVVDEDGADLDDRIGTAAFTQDPNHRIVEGNNGPRSWRVEGYGGVIEYTKYNDGNLLYFAGTLTVDGFADIPVEGSAKWQGGDLYEISFTQSSGLISGTIEGPSIRYVYNVADDEISEFTNTPLYNEYPERGATGGYTSAFSEKDALAAGRAFSGIIRNIEAYCAANAQDGG